MGGWGRCDGDWVGWLRLFMFFGPVGRNMVSGLFGRMSNVIAEFSISYPTLHKLGRHVPVLYVRNTNHMHV